MREVNPGKDVGKFSLEGAEILTLPFSKQEQYHWCQVTEICHILLMVSVAYGQGRIQRSRMRDMHLPTSYFQKYFNAYNFSIISNLFDSCKPSALSTHN